MWRLHKEPELAVERKGTNQRQAGIPQGGAIGYSDKPSVSGQALMEAWGQQPVSITVYSWVCYQLVRIKS